MNTKGYANPDLLMTPGQLYGRIHEATMCIVDVRPTHEYVVGHIPGALHLDLYGINLNNTGREAFEAFTWTLAYLMGSRGIGSGVTVVFYENDSGMRAARGFWICEYLGHGDVHVLDGGLQAWTAAGYETTVEVPIPNQTEFGIAPVAERNIGFEEIRDSLGRTDFVPLDTRSDDEYYGRGGAFGPGRRHPRCRARRISEQPGRIGCVQTGVRVGRDVRTGRCDAGADRGMLLTRRVPFLPFVPGVAPAGLSKCAQLYRVVEGMGRPAGSAGGSSGGAVVGFGHVYGVSYRRRGYGDRRRGNFRSLPFHIRLQIPFASRAGWTGAGPSERPAFPSVQD